MKTQAGSRDQEPVPAQRRAVRRGHRPARRSSATPAPSTGARYTDQMASYASGDVTTGTSWQFQVNLLQGEDQPIVGVLPDEGSTGWSDTWMIASKAKHPNCMYMWMDHMASAEANGQATVWFGEAPTSQAACDYAETISPGHCELTHATDEAYYDKIWYWSHPAGRLRRRRRGHDLQGPGRLGRSLDRRCAAPEPDERLIGSRAPRPRRGALVRRGPAMVTPSTAPMTRRPRRRRALAGSPGAPASPAWLYPRTRLQVGLLLAGPLGWLADRLPRGAVHPAAQRLLGEGRLHRQGRAVHVDARGLRAARRAGGLSDHRDPDRRDGHPRDRHRRPARLPDRLLHGPRSPRRAVRSLLVVAVLMPLWAAYLVKVYAWRIVLQGNGLLEVVLTPFGITGPGLDELANAWLVLSYLWLPYMILPIYAGLERIPNSLLEASADLGGRAGTTFRRVILPLVFPALVAGSIFTFSLTLGDYITPGPRRGRQVHRQRHLRQLEPRQPAARRRVLDAPDRDHDGLPPRRPAPRRLRVPVRSVDDRVARDPDPPADRDRRRARVPVPAAGHPGDLRVQPEPHPGLATDRLHAPLVRRGRSPTRRCSQAFVNSLIVRHGRDASSRSSSARWRALGRPALLASSGSRHDLVPPRPADRPAGRRHRHRAADVVRHLRHRLRAPDDHRRPRHVLRRHRLQQRHRPPAADCRGRPRRRRPTSAPTPSRRSGG